MVTSHPADAQAALDQVIADWNVASASWDATGIAATYSEDGMLFGGRPGHFVGRASIREYFASYDGVILSGSMRMSGMVVRELGSGCLLFQGMAHFEFTLAGSRQTQSQLRATLVLNREPDRWRIVDHHFSPIPAEPPLGND